MSSICRFGRVILRSVFAFATESHHLGLNTITYTVSYRDTDPLQWVRISVTYSVSALLGPHVCLGPIKTQIILCQFN